jgi:hypothetical protein
MPYPSQTKEAKYERCKEYRKNHKRDRTKEYEKERKTGPDKLWPGSFIGVDGEGWDGEYTLFAISGFDPLIDVNGLDTMEILDYVQACRKRLKGDNAFVGFGLGYDFENILRDLPEEDYLAMCKDGSHEVQFGQYVLKYLPKKILFITWETNIPKSNGKGNLKITVAIQDVWGFFQTSFEKALEKWGLEIPEEIRKGKAARNTFSESDLPFIIRYNQMELDLLEEMMKRVKQADVEAFNKIGIPHGQWSQVWFGPGARASRFLTGTRWKQEHPAFSGPAADLLSSRMENHSPAIRANPFSASFFGGRIEISYQGIYRGTVYHYDINSAYPYAISLLPWWNAGDLRHVIGLDPKRRMGMYHIRWTCSKASYYPFPFRHKHNVYFPWFGEGWYASPEVYAALDTWGNNIAIEVFEGFVLEDTDQAGDGLHRLPDAKLCQTARKITEMAALRLELKKQKAHAEKSLKLIMNSCYGKAIQQIGGHSLMNVFAATWITSVCRALIMRAIGTNNENILGIATDGLFSMIPLEAPNGLGPNLGQWELELHDEIIQYMPGIYQTKTGNDTTRRSRGFGKEFDFDRSYTKLRNHNKIEIPLRIFVTRRLALSQPNVYGDKAYRFVDLMKSCDFDLKAKRDYREKVEKHLFYSHAKGHKHPAVEWVSDPYDLDLREFVDYDKTTSQEELLSEQALRSIFQDMIQNGLIDEMTGRG